MPLYLPKPGNEAKQLWKTFSYVVFRLSLATLVLSLICIVMNDPNSPEFYVSIIAAVLLTILAFLIHISRHII